jgi:nicotinate-nucleotide adenylyltransferase
MTEPTPAAVPVDQPIVIFGGTFDPPHRRHVELARGIDALLGAKQLLVVPAWRNPQRAEAAAPPADRVAMCELAFADIADAQVLRVEVESAAPCYSIDTVQRILEMQAAGAIMSGPLRLVVGSDQALNFRTWRDWDRLTTLAEPAVALRPPHTREDWPGLVRASFDESWAARWLRWTLPIDPVQVSSTEIRRRLGAGEPVGDMLTPAVAAYVRKRGLYGAQGSSFADPAKG